VTGAHDKFLKSLMDRPKAARALFRERLPRELVAQLADSPPELVDGAFVDDELRGRLSDRLFKLKMRGEQELFVYCLMEHKSAPEALAALQLLGYMVRVWERLAREGRCGNKLPLIIPLVIYHGAAPWKVPTSFSSVVQLGPGLGIKPLDFDMVLVNLEGIDDSALSGEPTLRAGLLALKYATREGMQLSRLSVVLGGLKAAPSLLRLGLIYMMETYRRVDRAVLLGEAKRVMPEHEERIMTIAQELRAEGRKEGIREGIRKGIKEGLEEGVKRGRVEGQRDALLRVLRRRFGRIPKAARARVMAAELPELDTWLDRALDAQRIDAVFRATH